MPAYLKIENPGVVPADAITTLGVSMADMALSSQTKLTDSRRVRYFFSVTFVAERMARPS